MKHGHARKGAKTGTYSSWCGMFARCYNKKKERFPYYGGRGITVCRRWFSFENFLFDMGERPPGMSLDRKNNDGNYNKRNCRWLSMSAQARNKSSNRVLKFNGEQKPMIAWAQQFKMNYFTLADRLDEGWTVADALTTPVRKRRKAS